MTPRYTLTLFLDDMGSFTQPGCTSIEDALWHVNRARDHDGLHPLSLNQFRNLPGSRKGSSQWAEMKPE